jgi:2-dehydro-3-deoxygalactonokinase
MTETVLGIDWGTSNRRAYVLDEQGRLQHQHNDGFGILAVEGNFEESLRQLLQTLGLNGGDIYLSGMVGSRNGWREVPYIDTGISLERLAETLVEIPCGIEGVRCKAVPGIRHADPHGMPDVMRGEEAQIFGAMALGAPDGWYALPGTHCKWVLVEGRRISRLITFMTGEFFHLLTHHGTLASLMKEQTDTPEAFEAGLQAAQYHGFTHAAFVCRALVVTDSMPANQASSYLSGLLIGAELAEIRRLAASNTVQIIGSPSLARRYAFAMEHFGMPATLWQPDEVYVAAIGKLAGLKN